MFLHVLYCVARVGCGGRWCWYRWNLRFCSKGTSDVVYVELPEVGDTFDAEEAFGSVESVKAASDIYLPVAGEVVEVNDGLGSSPNLVNESPTSDGWFVKVKLDDPAELENLMDESSYAEHRSNE